MPTKCLINQFPPILKICKFQGVTQNLHEPSTIDHLTTIISWIIYATRHILRLCFRWMARSCMELLETIEYGQAKGICIFWPSKIVGQLANYQCTGTFGGTRRAEIMLEIIIKRQKFRDDCRYSWKILYSAMMKELSTCTVNYNVF